MPHQQLVADVAGELLPDGTPAYREIIVTMMRQQGKTTLILAIEVERCTLRGKPQRVAYTAQTGTDARKKLLIDQVPILQSSPLWPSVRKVGAAADNVSIAFKNHSRIDVLASGPSAGHGKIFDLGMLDEAFDDLDDRREQAMLPAMITRPDAQLFIVSAMGTDASVYLNRKVEAGRAAALEGRTSGIAYFEWAIPLDEDIDDPKVWRRYMPALGHTIGEAAVAHARTTMSDGEFRRAFGNQRTRSDERAIPAVTWAAACRPDVKASGQLTYAVEVSPDRDVAALAVAGGDVVELGDYRPGVGWVVGRLAELAQRSGAQVVVDARGPAGSLIGELTAAGVRVLELSTAEVTKACGGFYDALADGKVQIRSNADLDVAASVVAKRPVADAWCWGRRSSADVSPIVAVTLAWAASKNDQPLIFAY